MEYERRRDTVTARVAGELDHCSAQQVRRELDRLIAEPGIRHLVLDLGDMTFMDSSGIGVLLGRYREMQLRGGTVAVKNMNPHVEKIFTMSGMRQIIEIL